MFPTKKKKVLSISLTNVQQFCYLLHCFFLSDGQLRHTETDERFEFEVRKEDPKYNQKRYEALGEVITEYVYNLLETEVGLKRITIPVSCGKLHSLKGSGDKLFLISCRRQARNLCDGDVLCVCMCL